MNLEGRISCSVQYIKDEEGRLLRDMGLTCDRRVQRFNSLLNTKSRALDRCVVEELKVWPPCARLDDLLSLFEGGNHQEHVKPRGYWTR